MPLRAIKYVKKLCNSGEYMSAILIKRISANYVDLYADVFDVITSSFLFCQCAYQQKTSANLVFADNGRVL